jgi:enamine deaminase RidA (YjgF/YER057c/UK114 family)
MGGNLLKVSSEYLVDGGCLSERHEISERNMLRINPKTIMVPVNNAYAHGVLIPPGANVLYISGQIGAGPDGDIPADPAAQAEIAWSNVMAIVREAGMDANDIVKLTAYIVDDAAFPPYAAARNRDIGAISKAAATTVFVPRLLKLEWKIEIEAIAARA